MYPPHMRRDAVTLLDNGKTYSEVNRQLGINRSTLREWFQNRELVDKYNSDSCVRCTPTPCFPEPQPEYSYLLGVYLGDGCISRIGAPVKGVWRLRITCSDTWPVLTQECIDAIRMVRPFNSIGKAQKSRCVEVYADWRHWPCIFPQHGPGVKHARRIALAPWQVEIVERHAERFVRGLIHSDGCRVTNRVRQKVYGEWRYYEYPRYFFTNTSTEIAGLLCDALDLLGIQWKSRSQLRANLADSTVISIAQRDSVALLDSFIGPKH